MLFLSDIKNNKNQLEIKSDRLQHREPCPLTLQKDAFFFLFYLCQGFSKSDNPFLSLHFF
jgi:hypothetical protein